jgi:hypothetical protein
LEKKSEKKNRKRGKHQRKRKNVEDKRKMDVKWGEGV